MQSRLKYLNSHTLKQDDKEETEGGEEKAPEQEEVPPPQTPLSLHGDQGDENLTLEPPPAPTPTEMLQPMDLSPFLKYVLKEHLLTCICGQASQEQRRNNQIFWVFQEAGAWAPLPWRRGDPSAGGGTEASGGGVQGVPGPREGVAGTGQTETQPDQDPAAGAVRGATGQSPRSSSPPQSYTLPAHLTSYKLPNHVNKMLCFPGCC